MRLIALAAALALFAETDAFASCSAMSTDTTPHLIELYSSEGCSSCPPAENWLRGLHAGADVVPLEFHVDYWDDLGWRDPFGDARYTLRQRGIAARSGSGAVYTPELVLDGQPWGGWYRGGHLSPVKPGGLSMTVSSTQADHTLHVSIVSMPQNGVAADRYRTYAALVEDGLTSRVRTGENGGATLHHDHVVRAFVGPLSIRDARADFTLPREVDLTHASIVAFAQNPDDGAVAQVVSLPLDRCTTE